jgi:hypothetical protein
MLDNLNKVKGKVEEVCIAMEKQNLQLGKMITLFQLCDCIKLYILLKNNITITNHKKNP